MSQEIPSFPIRGDGQEKPKEPAVSSLDWFFGDEEGVDSNKDNSPGIFDELIPDKPTNSKGDTEKQSPEAKKAPFGELFIRRITDLGLSKDTVKILDDFITSETNKLLKGSYESPEETPSIEDLPEESIETSKEKPEFSNTYATIVRSKSTLLYNFLSLVHKKKKMEPDDTPEQYFAKLFPKITELEIAKLVEEITNLESRWALILIKGSKVAEEPFTE